MAEDGTAALEAFEPILPEWVDAVTAADEAREEGEALSASLDGRWRNSTVEADARSVVHLLQSDQD